MASKDTPPLYEFVHRSEKDPKRAMALPAWMNKHRDAEEQAEAAATPKPQAQPEPETVTAKERSAVAERAGEPAVGERVTAGAGRIDVAAARAWMQSTVAFRLPRSTVVLLGIGAVVALAIVFLIGQKLGKRSAVGEELDYQKAEATVSPYREQPARSLIPSTVAGVERGAGDLDRAGVPSPPGDAGASGSADDPRDPGLNYYRLVVLPSDADEVNRIIDYLGANGVDAAAIPINNGRSVKILALKGFSKPLSDPEAQRYEQLLGQLGRKWKAEHRGSSDWKDMLPEKYRPGRT